MDTSPNTPVTAVALQRRLISMVLVAFVVPMLAVVEALAGPMLVLGRILLQIGAALVLAALMRPRPNNGSRLFIYGLALTAAGLVGEGGARFVARPMSFSPLPMGLGLLLVLAALVVATRSERVSRASLTAMVFTALGLLAASGGPAALDSSTVVASAAAVVLPVIGLAVVVARLTGVRSVPIGWRLALSGLGLLGVFGVVRSIALYRIGEYYSDAVSLTALLVILASVVTLLFALVPSPQLRRRHTVAALAVPLTLALLAAATPSLLPLERDRFEGLAKVSNAVEADLQLVQGMIEEVGAGPRPEFRGKSFYDCDRLNSRDCFITHYDDIALRAGVAAAVADVVEKVKTNKGATFPAHCHQVVHNLGQMAYQLADRFGDAAELDPQVCGTGYTHGLWEQQFDVLGTKVMFDRTGSLCKELNMVSDWYKWTCHHILGHMMSADLSTDPSRATEYCTKVEDPQGLTDCLTGGWMNFFQDDVVVARMRASGNLEDLFGICYGASQDTKFFCYQELFPAIYAAVDGGDFAAGQACLDYAEPSGGEGFPWTLSAKNYTDRCVQGLARGIGASSAQNYLLMRDRCQSMPTAAQDPCLVAAAASYVLNTGGAKTAFEICKAVTDDAYREYCYFWTKHARQLLANGPNSENLPDDDEVRLPEDTGYWQPPGFVVENKQTPQD
jgi:hypothetical protein